MKKDVHLAQIYKDNLKCYNNDLTVKPDAVIKKNKEAVKRSGLTNETGNGVEQDGVVGRNQNQVNDLVV